MLADVIRCPVFGKFSRRLAEFADRCPDRGGLEVVIQGQKGLRVAKTAVDRVIDETKDRLRAAANDKAPNSWPLNGGPRRRA